MAAQQSFKCKTCGQLLDDLVLKSTNGTVECPSCYNSWTIPKKETSPEALHFLSIGEHDLDVGKFDDALAAYNKAAELDSTEPEAYFGLALAQFKVRYLKDHVNNRLQPICGEIAEKKFVECEAFKKAIKNGTDAQRAEYEKKGAEIDYILGEFYKLKQSEKRYDCFICVKVTDNETGQQTEDSRDADYIYRLLQDKGYKPFYSERELRNVTGADYEARILYALFTAECMLVVCRKEEYLQTPWVKNEYTRFLKLVNDEEKESDSITLVFNGKPVEKLPGRAGKLQGIDFALREADGKIVDFVDAHTPEARRRREEEKKKKAEQEEVILKQIEEQKAQQKMLEDRLKNLQQGGGRGMQATASSLLTRGYQELASGNKDGADGFFDRVLDAEPENGEAWWGRLLLELDVWNDDLLDDRLDLNSFETLSESRNFSNAKEYAAGEFKEHFDEVNGRLSEVAATRNENLNDRCKELDDIYNEKEKKGQGKISSLNNKVNEAKKNVSDATSKVPVKEPKFRPLKYRLRSVRRAFKFIAIPAAIAWFIYFVVLSYEVPEEEFAKMNILLTWGHYELSSTTAFFIAIAKSVTYGIAAAIIILLIPTIIVCATNSYKKNKAREYYDAKYALDRAKEELESLEKELEEEKEKHNGEMRKIRKKINELRTQSGIYSKFLQTAHGDGK